MNGGSEYEKKLMSIYLRPILLLLAGVLIIISAIPESLEWSSIKRNGILTEATVYSVRKTSFQYGRTSGTVHTAYVKFMYDGREYEGELNIFAPEIREGSTVSIMVSRDDPYKFMAEPRKSGSLYGAGIILIFFGGFMMYIAVTRLRE